eukprot:jgi/Botrbrau1/3263/Bobra.174_1s0034.1
MVLLPWRPPADITADTPTVQRSEMCRIEAAVFVTTRILVVDMLSACLQPHQVAGVIVLNAHKVTDTSGEGFALRLFRAGNKKGFVRALSDQPVHFSHGFAKMVEVAVRQTPAMAETHEACLQLMEACIKELQKSSKIDSSELSLE